MRLELSVLGKHIIQVLFVDGHEPSDKRLQMKDLLTSQRDTVFIKSCPFDNLLLQAVVQVLHEFASQSLDNDICWNTIDQELVEFLSGSHESTGSLLTRNLNSELTNVKLPIRFLNGLVLGETIAFLNMAGFQHENGASKVARRLACNANGQFFRQSNGLSRRNVLKDGTNLEKAKGVRH
jgi:hypothetical protein